MKNAGAREIARASNELLRLLKDLRDGNEVGASLGPDVASVARNLPPARVTAALRALNRLDWITTVLAGDPKAIARLSPRGVPTSGPVLPDPDASVITLPAVSTRSERGRVRRGQPARSAAQVFEVLTPEDVLRVHAALVDDFMNSDDPIFPPGLKNADLLASATSRQSTGFAGESKYKRFSEMATSLFYGLAMNHPFHNGNKRTALVSLLVVADKNRMTVVADQDELYEFVLNAVEHKFRPRNLSSATEATDRELDALAAWLQPRIRRNQHRSRMVKWRELRVLLRNLGCEAEIVSGSQIEITRPGSYRCVVDFDGDTREVGPPIVRKVRRDLALSEAEGVDDEVFFGYVPPLDVFIAKYRRLLRSLARV